MRFAIIYSPKHPIPQDQIAELLKGMAGWMESHQSRLEGVQFFVGGGGFGTVDVSDTGDLTRMISEHPFTQYSEVEIKPLVDPATAMAILQETYA
jgi:hypothetical protein